MATKTKIEWTESTWNPVTGCTKISDGCKNCYAERMAKRLHLMGQPNYRNQFNVTLHEHVLSTPFTWKKPQMIFVNSMSDLFHDEVSEGFILEIFDAMKLANWHTYQILTKRSERLAQLSHKLKWDKHIWAGVTVESSKYKNRIDHLRNSETLLKFISFEPLLDSVGELNLQDIDWVIVGGESGPKSRPMQEKWVKEIQKQCKEQNVPFFFKQWGGVNKKKNGRLLDDKTWNEMPKI